jgi:hypothetical protein
LPLQTARSAVHRASLRRDFGLHAGSVQPQRVPRRYPGQLCGALDEPM